jgi:hypothetical protein
MSGASTVAELSGAEALGTTRINANATLVPTIGVTGPPISATEMTVTVIFIDDNGHSGSAQTSTGVRLDLTGDWTGQLPIRTAPTADWSSARMALVQSRDVLTGELVSRDGTRFPLNGNVPADSPPTLTVYGLSPIPFGCGVFFVLASSNSSMAG